MPPPFLKHTEWFLRNIVDRNLMKQLGERIIFYDELFEEVIYRAHHNSFKIVFADIYYKDFEVITRACGLKKNYYKYLPNYSTLKYMIEERKRFRKKKKKLIGDIRWSLPFFLSQLSFWYTTVKSFYEVWRKVVFEDYRIPPTVSWEEGIVLYIICDFVEAFYNSNGKCVRKEWRKKYEEYIRMQKGSQPRAS